MCIRDSVHVVEDLRWLNDRIIRAIGARRLTPEVHGIGPPRADRLLEAIELFGDRRRVRLRLWGRLVLLCRQTNGGRGAHRHADDGAACRDHHRVLPLSDEPFDKRPRRTCPWSTDRSSLHTAYRNPRSAAPPSPVRSWPQTERALSLIHI